MKFVDWSEDTYGEGEIVATCETCGREERSDTFTENEVDYKEFQSKLNSRGWISTRVNHRWKDFCCERCRNDFIKKYGG